MPQLFRHDCIVPPAISLHFPFANPHSRARILRHYVQSRPHHFDRSSMAKQNFSHGGNVVCNGSPSRILSVRRISLGITTRPRSSMRRTIPVAFINCSSNAFRFTASADTAGCKAIVCMRRRNIQVRARLRRRQPFYLSACMKNRTREAPASGFSCGGGLYASGRLRFRKSIVMHHRPAMPTIA